MIYIASPYYHKDLKVMNKRADEVAKYAAHLLTHGRTCYSPIAHGHAIQEYLPDDLRGDHKFWLAHDFPFLIKCEEYHLLALDGWDTSRGCKWEYETSKAFSIDRYFISPEDYGSTLMLNGDGGFA